MNYPYHIRLLHAAFLLLTSLLPIGCASTSKPLADTTPLPVETPTLPSDSPYATVRTPENLKAYPVGRYADPDSPTVMHEAHEVYRVETSPQWNTAPNAPTTVPLGPTQATGASSVAVGEPARQQVMLTAELEQKIKEEDQLLKTSYEQNERLVQELKKLQDMLPKLRPPEEPSQPVVSTASPPLQQVVESSAAKPITTSPSVSQKRTWREWLRSYWPKSTPPQPTTKG